MVDTSLTGLRVARELDRIAELRGYPGMIVSDNGTELTSNAILARGLVGFSTHIYCPVTRPELHYQNSVCRDALTKLNGVYRVYP